MPLNREQSLAPHRRTLSGGAELLGKQALLTSLGPQTGREPVHLYWGWFASPLAGADASVPWSLSHWPCRFCITAKMPACADTIIGERGWPAHYLGRSARTSVGTSASTRPFRAGLPTVQACSRIAGTSGQSHDQACRPKGYDTKSGNSLSARKPDGATKGRYQLGTDGDVARENASGCAHETCSDGGCALLAAANSISPASVIGEMPCSGW